MRLAAGLGLLALLLGVATLPGARTAQIRDRIDQIGKIDHAATRPAAALRHAVTQRLPPAPALMSFGDEPERTSQVRRHAGMLLAEIMSIAKLAAQHGISLRPAVQPTRRVLSPAAAAPRLKVALAPAIQADDSWKQF
ncbi:MAG: hypothetical protein V4754_22240 [Pseudomonadota bacterium]